MRASTLTLNLNECGKSQDLDNLVYIDLLIMGSIEKMHYCILCDDDVLENNFTTVYLNFRIRTMHTMFSQTLKYSIIGRIQSTLDCVEIVEAISKH